MREREAKCTEGVAAIEKMIRDSEQLRVASPRKEPPQAEKKEL